MNRETRPLNAFLYEAKGADGERVALRFDDLDLTYRELAERVDRCAAFLAKSGVG